MFCTAVEHARHGAWCITVVLSGIACTRAPAPSVTLPYQQSFAEMLGPEWTASNGGWRVVDGRLFNDGAHNVPLWLGAALPHDVTVSFAAESKSDAVDLKFEIFADGLHHASGYVVILAGWHNSRSIIGRLDEHGPERSPAQEETLRREVATNPDRARARHAKRRDRVSRTTPQEPHRIYHVRCERRGHELTLLIDDALYLSYFDPAPLSGAGHDRFAFNNWASEVYFDDLHIEPL